MATVSIAPFAVPQFFDTTGAPASGGTLETYLAGTSTPEATYSDNGSTTNATTITLNSAGRPHSGGTLVDIRLDITKSYKFILKDTDGNTIRTVDNILGGLPAASVGAMGRSRRPSSPTRNQSFPRSSQNWSSSRRGQVPNIAMRTRSWASSSRSSISSRRASTLASSPGQTPMTCHPTTPPLSTHTTTSISPRGRTTGIWICPPGAARRSVARAGM